MLLPDRIVDAHVTAGPTLHGEIDPGALIAQMDAHGIHQAVLSPGDRWLAVDNREGHQALLSWIRRWPARFQGYATANPWYGDRAMAELERALDAGLSAVKLHPARQGFMLLEPMVDPILEMVQRRGVPVYVVTGVPVASMPLQLAELARRYPEARFIMGRSGRTDFALDILPTVRQAPRIYVETVYNLPATLEAVAQAIGVERILFASDAPFTHLRLELDKVERMNLAPEARTAILGGNLTRLLGMTET